MSLELKYVPLSFISSNEEILKQVRNTVIFSYLFNQYEETTLNHYIESTQYGYTASAGSSGSHRFVRITDINSEVVDWDRVPFCNCESDEKYLLRENDILVARTGGTTGKSFFVSNAPSNAIFASYLIRLRLKKGVDIDFIESFLNSYAFWSQVIEMKSGSAMPNVNAEKLKTLKLPKCENETQKIVGNFFKNNDYQKNHSNLYKKVKDIEVIYDKSNNISSESSFQLSLIKKLRQQLLQDAVQGKLVSQDPNDEPASELLIKIKAEKEQLIKEKKFKREKELPVIKKEEIPFEIPEGWVWCRLGELIELISGQHIDTSNYNEIGIGLPYLTGPSDFGAVSPMPTRWTTKPKVISEDGDILITVKGSGVGKTNVNDLDKVVISRQLMAIRVKRIDKKFVHYFIKYSFDLLQAEKKGTGIPGIGRENITERLIPLPPLPEQHRIVQKIEQLLQTCDELEESIKLSVSLNENLLQQVLREALNGKDRICTSLDSEFIRT